MQKTIETTLCAVYGADPDALAAQAARYRRGLAAFAERYGAGPVAVYRAPGRVNLIGEHTDYSQGYVLPMALDKDVLLFVRPRHDQRVRLANAEPQYAERSFAIARDIAPRPKGDWANYIQGPAQLLAREHGDALRGFDGWVEGAPPYGVPRGAGLSSSSALTVAAGTALAGVNRLPLAAEALAEACSRAEWYVGTRGGIMDHFVSVLGRPGQALYLDCRPLNGASFRHRHVPLPPDCAVLVADSGVRHTNTGPFYNRRVAEVRIAARLLARRYAAVRALRDAERLDWCVLEPLLPDSLSEAALRAEGIDPETLLDGASPETDVYAVRRRARHVISENRRVVEAVAALEAGDAPTFGRLMSAAHASARDDYEISTPEIETLVRLAESTPGVLGARITGAGWGGCIVALARADTAARAAEALAEGYRGATGRSAGVTICRSSAGAGLALKTEVP